MLKKALFVFLSAISLSAYAAGIITHELFADQSRSQQTSIGIQQILSKHSDSFLVGAGYPDTGYLKATYGEDTHWAPFMNAFIGHIQDKGGIAQNEKLVAFLLGIHSHNVSDIIWHWGFISQTSKCSGKGWQEIHDLADIDLELAIASEHFGKHPSLPIWSIPIDDLVAIYAKMGKNYPPQEIIRSNVLYYLVAMAEHISMKSRALRWGYIRHAKKVFPACGYDDYPATLNFIYKEVDHDRELLWNALLTNGTVTDYPKPHHLDAKHHLQNSIDEEMISWVKIKKTSNWYEFSLDPRYLARFEERALKNFLAP